LMARRRAREETRLRTPGLFSTYAISVCIGLSSLGVPVKNLKPTKS
jgi:hypothetical protein